MSYNKILTGVSDRGLCVLAFLLCYKWTTTRGPSPPQRRPKHVQGAGEEPSLRGGLHRRHAVSGGPDVQPELLQLPVPLLLQRPRPEPAAPGVHLSAGGRGDVLRRQAGAKSAKDSAPTASVLGCATSPLLPAPSVWIFLGAVLSGIGARSCSCWCGRSTDAIDYNAVRLAHDEATSYASHLLRKLGQTSRHLEPSLRIGYTDTCSTPKHHGRVSSDV